MKLKDYVAINPSVKLDKKLEYSFVEMKNIKPFKKIVRSINKRRFTGSGSKFIDGDTLLARITPCLENGKTAQYKGNKETPAWGSTEFIVLRGKKNFTENDFVYYLSISNEFRNYAIQHMIGTSGRQRVPNDVVGEFEFEFPDLPTQKKIANILGTLDKKIELNQKINQTLEDIAKSIFKSWFIDFDPVKAKAEGKPTGLPDEINNLFPSSFENSTYGKIPKGWQMLKIGDCCDTVIGGTPSRTNKEFWKGKNGWINSGSVNEFPLITPSEYISDTATKKSSTKFSKKKSTLIALVTAINKGLITFSEIDVFINQSIVAIQPGDIIFPEYIYLYTDHNYRRLYREQSGGAQQHINKDIVNKFEILKPSNKILISFKNLFKNLFEKIALNTRENIILSDLRDTLISKIISGKLKTPNVKKLIDRISS
jgi:type I restriction enzyme, S subunit